MPKNATREIQDFIVDLGNRLGFEAISEYSFAHLKIPNSYCPIYDVVWFLKLDRFNTNNLAEKYISNKSWHNLLSKVPIATFEIEGSTVNSKYQVGNFANLFLNPSMYNFVIVNNKEASNENDTYRRGIKIQRTIKEFLGGRNTLFADWSQIKNISIDIGEIGSCEITIPPGSSSVRSAFGGEKKSVTVYNDIVEDFEDVGMCLKQNYTPEIFKSLYYKIESMQSIECSERFDILLGKKFTYDPTRGLDNTKQIKRMSSYFYLPKIDFVLGFYLPISFVLFLREFGKAIRDDIVNNDLLNFIKNKNIKELFFPYLGCEIESSSSKHLAGGIFNCSKYCFSGLLISPIEGANYLKAYRDNLGITNVFHYECSF